MLRVLLVESPEPRTEQPGSPDPLTPRETDVLKLIVQGYTNRQVGEELGISVRTVEGHRANLLEKLGLRTRVELVRYARDRGLIG
jgi:two-component system response regulator NreC